MPFLMIRHDVADFDQWKKKYSAHETARRAAGLTEVHLLRDVEKPTHVILMFSVSDVQRAKEFGASADLQAAMKDAGVVGKPDINFLNEA
jgi:uncharacterized protein YeaO (DUF488 family)